VLHEYFCTIAPNLDIVSPLEAQAEVVTFHNRVADQLAKRGVTIPRAKVANLQEQIAKTQAETAKAAENQIHQYKSKYPSALKFQYRYKSHNCSEVIIFTTSFHLHP
jgi:hypothetical protein